MAIPVAYVTGLAMRRAADLYAGAAKTDPKEAQVLADFAWRNADRLTWTTVTLRSRIAIRHDANLEVVSAPLNPVGIDKGAWQRGWHCPTGGTYRLGPCTM